MLHVTLEKSDIWQNMQMRKQRLKKIKFKLLHIMDNGELIGWLKKLFNLKNGNSCNSIICYTPAMNNN